MDALWNPIWIWNCSEITVLNNEIINSGYSVWLTTSKAITLESNLINNSVYESIVLEDCLGDCLISNNDIVNGMDLGIWLDNSPNTVIINNLIDISDYGIVCDFSNQTTITNNKIYNSLNDGIDLTNSNLSAVSGNLVINSSLYGLNINTAIENSIKSNTFIKGGIVLNTGLDNKITSNNVSYSPYGIYAQGNSYFNSFGENFISLPMADAYIATLTECVCV